MRRAIRVESTPKLHVVLTKEEVDSDQVGSGKVAVVFDVLLATTTISALLEYGAKEIIPVLDGAAALHTLEELQDSSAIVTGEVGGRTIQGFFDPLPTRLKEEVKGKTVVLSTTNGTVAILKASTAERVYAGSLVNASAMADRIATDHGSDTILAVCAGSGGRFSLEDFYGAGCFIHELLDRKEVWELTDSAKAALYFYRGNAEQAIELLSESTTGEMMREMGLMEDVQFAARKNSISVVPQLEKGRMMVKPPSSAHIVNGGI
ncbi:2-phosphosulfolactate phosphatase [Sporosarcina sp. 179-K 3D1 HS]|uniref:2-phosphosulfolactate phosphatase n=1 Tax=Sporosarcina sp. 179-K 3D1 HS TaxID=3232169 RepID=UPI00399FDBEC